MMRMKKRRSIMKKRRSIMKKRRSIMESVTLQITTL